ncbi:hypothetical protein DW962_16155 [Blautia sp. AM46-5]|nr:hypothetical protein DW962_16155 [Blautia sp. AM46-5]
MYNDQQPNPGSWQEEEQRMTLPPKRGNGFSTASMTAGTLSLFFLVSGLSFPVGALGILFALLSRKGDKMDPQAKLGCILSIIGLCLASPSLFTPQSPSIRISRNSFSSISSFMRCTRAVCDCLWRVFDL